MMENSCETKEVEHFYDGLLSYFIDEEDEGDACKVIDHVKDMDRDGIDDYHEI